MATVAPMKTTALLPFHLSLPREIGSLLLLGALLAASPCGLAGKAENPFDRMTPVPADQPIPAVDFFRPSLFCDPKLNDDGTMFAAIVTAGVDRRELLVYDFATAKFDRLHGAGSKDIDGFDWLDDEQILYYASEDKRYRTGMFVAEARDLSNNRFLDLHSYSIVVARPESARLKPIIWIRNCAYNSGKDGGVHQIDTTVYSRNVIAESAYIDPGSILHGTMASVCRTFPDASPGTPMWYSPDPSGNLGYAFTTEAGVQRLLRLVDDKWVQSPADLEDLEVISGSSKPNELIVKGPRQDGKPCALQFMDAVTGKLGDVIWQDDRYDPTGCRIYRHPVTKVLPGIRFDRGMRQSIWFDKGYQAIQQSIEKLLPGQVVVILGSDKAEKRFFVSASSDRQPTTYYSIDLEKRTLGLIKSEAPWLDSARMQPTSMINYKSRDGIALEGYLTLPAGASKTNPAPMVVLPHGGPWVRDSWGYDGEVQFLASRGYAVFQPNYRGSPGYQWRFPKADIYEFLKMHDDVTDGVQKLLKTGLVDGDRVAIMGWSFGGYLALSGATRDGQLYRCAVALSGVYDWEKVIKDSRNEQMLRGWDEFLLRKLGDPKKDKEKFAAISPVRHVAKVKIPIFVGHGGADIIADVSQSKHLVSELKKYGVPTVTRFVSGEGHGMQQMQNRVEMYEAIEKFLAANMAPRVPAPLAAVAAPAH